MPEIRLPAGYTVPIPKWATHGFGVVAVLAIAFGSYRYFFPAPDELISAQQANHLLRLEIQEYNRHIVEAPVATVETPDGSIHLEAFVDGCVVLAHKLAGVSMTKLILGPLRTDTEHSGAGDLGDTATGGHALLQSLVPTLAAAAQRRPVCLNPHPGEFQWTYGKKRDACWIEVWRRWPDGCEHVQLLNTCTGLWATTDRGEPLVQWTRCVH